MWNTMHRSEPADWWSYQLIRELADIKLHVDSTEHNIVLRDTHPKARVHYLVLPRKDINTIYELTKDDLEMLADMIQLGRRVARTSGLDDSVFRYGFHMAPHMKRLHLHVISQDFDSPHLKRVSHWNIFNSEIFISHDAVVEELKMFGKVLPRSKVYCEQIRNGVMRCHSCNFSCGKLREIKEHIKFHW